MSTDRIDAYLDDLLDRLEGTAAERRRMLNEAEAHLRDSAAVLQLKGSDPEAAQEAAIAAFGDGPTIAQAANRRDPAAMLAAFVPAAAQLAVNGFVAIGVATLLARGLALVTSTQWVYGSPANYRFTPAQCTHWLAVQPNATDCRAAAAMESSDDSFLFILAAAVVGLIVTGIVLAVMRLARRRRLTTAARLPHYLIAAIGATAFLGAAVALLAAAAADGVGRVAWGQGVLYADGAVALVFGLVFLVRFLSTIRPVPSTISA